MAAPDTQAMLLASASPRRRRLLTWLGLPFSVAAVDTPEDLDSPLAADPAALAAELASDKAIAARDAGLAREALILAFDTIVVLDRAVLGKPRDDADAWRMLRALSGRTHRVVTGCALLRPGAEEANTFSVTTDVLMEQLTDCRIEAWMALGEYMGCAGAYNIEGQVAQVTELECYQNVAGLPLCHLFAELTNVHGGPTSPIPACDEALRRRCRLGPLVIEGSDAGRRSGERD